MCPLCLGTATLLVSGTTSASGIALVLLRKHFPKPHTRASPPVPAGAENPTVPRNGMSDDAPAPEQQAYSKTNLGQAEWRPARRWFRESAQ